MSVESVILPAEAKTKFFFSFSLVQQTLILGFFASMRFACVAQSPTYLEDVSTFYSKPMYIFLLLD